MTIIQPVIRPPSEARSFLLQVTTSCSVNSCTFCGAYKNKVFNVKPFSEIKEDIEIGAQVNPNTRKVFLMDGDALVLPNKKLVPILKIINQNFKKLTRISSYANGDQIANRNDSELKELRDNKLSLIYIGLESGCQQILNLCKKRASAEEMIQAVQQASKYGIKSSAIVLLGLGGKELSDKHVSKTIIAINKMQPRYLSFLSLMLIPGTEKYQEMMNKQFAELNPIELLAESYQILNGLNLEKTIFRSNHASNYLALEGRLPQDKEKLLNQVKSAMAGETSIKPEFLRGL